MTAYSAAQKPERHTVKTKNAREEIMSNNYNSNHPRYRELMDAHPAIKEAVQEMQNAIDRTPFKGVIGVGIRECGADIWVLRNYTSTRRFVNRVNAYSESYEKLRKHLVPTQFVD
jgi:hypothetical protein